MNTAVKLMGFVVGITLVFFATYAIGNAVGPVGQPPQHEHAAVHE